MGSIKQHTGIILAGGQSSRLGRDKGLIEVKNKTLVEHAADVLSAFCDEILVSSNNPDYCRLPYRIIPDISPGWGPMMGIYSALKVSSEMSNLVLAVDNIFVTSAFYEYLLATNYCDYMAAVPFVQNMYYEPLVGYYSADCIPVMENMMQAGNYKLPDLFSRITTSRLIVETDFLSYRPGYFRSLNNPGDLFLLDALPLPRLK